MTKKILPKLKNRSTRVAPSCLKRDLQNTIRSINKTRIRRKKLKNFKGIKNFAKDFSKIEEQIDSSGEELSKDRFSVNDPNEDKSSKVSRRGETLEEQKQKKNTGQTLDEKVAKGIEPSLEDLLAAKGYTAPPKTSDDNNQDKDS